MGLYIGLLPNRGPVASTSGPATNGSLKFPYFSFTSYERNAARQAHFATLAVPKQAEAAARGDSQEALDAWEEVWVNNNGSQVTLDVETEVPAQLLTDFDDKKQATRRIPAEMRYFDTASIHLKAGDGGNGCIAFRREKFVPRGGPSGGNGGRGGHVWAVVDDGSNSLSNFRGRVHYRAAPGVSGGGSGKHGANGSDVEVRVPHGTIVRRKGAHEDEQPLAELVKQGARALLAAGGRGGRGNASFKTGSNNAPQLAESGEAGQELWVELELKLVADVGIIGVPNAGKSTLLSVVSAAKPKVADYPFTTLVPNLGVCELDFRTTVFADIPGLLEGAHTGLGLGHEFLRHCQRSRVLVHIIDGSSRDPIGDYTAICAELQLFNPELLEKPQVVAYNKMDLPDASDYWEEVQEYLRGQGIEAENLIAISAATGQGVIDLVRRLRVVLDAVPCRGEELSTNALNLREPPSGPSQKRMDEFRITANLAEGRVFTVEGEAIERFAQMTNWSYYEALLRFQKVLDASGITKALREKGIREGDVVAIGDAELEWSDDQSEGAVYSRWLDERKAQGKALKGSSAWPHAG